MSVADRSHVDELFITDRRIRNSWIGACCLADGRSLVMLRIDCRPTFAKYAISLFIVPLKTFASTVGMRLSQSRCTSARKVASGRIDAFISNPQNKADRLTVFRFGQCASDWVGMSIRKSRKWTATLRDTVPPLDLFSFHSQVRR